MNIASYFKTFFFTVLLLVGTVSTANYMINPLGAYGSPVIKGLNDQFPAASSYARIYRSEAVKRLKPEVLITGTSRAMIGMDPQPEMFGGARVYNMGMSAATIAEQRRVVEFTHAVHPLKKIIMPLDFLSFNAFRPDRGADAIDRYNPKNLTPLKSFLYRYNTVPTLDTLLASFRHLRYMKQLERRSVYMPNGRLHQYDLLWRFGINGVAKEFSRPNPDKDIAGETFSVHYAGKNAGTTYHQFEAILDFARRNGIEVIVLLSPLHERYLAQFEQKGEVSLWLEWKKRIEDIVRANGLRYGADPYPLWDFQYLNSITTEPVPPLGDTESRMRWFHDDNHYSPATGDLVLRKILGLTDQENDPYPDFGQRLL